MGRVVVDVSGVRLLICRCIASLMFYRKVFWVVAFSGF